MERKRITVISDVGEHLVFGIDEYEDHIVLGKYFNEDVVRVSIPKEILNKAVVSIGNECFWAHKEIREVIIPDSVKSIGFGAFALCTGLHSIILPDSIENIEPHAFRDCAGLSCGKIVLPASLRTLKHGVFSFSYLTTETEIVIPEGLEVIESHAFYSCGLFELKLPSSVKEIQPGAFAQCGVKLTTNLPRDEKWFKDIE